jgi:Cu-Zn family superoxide dismutase
MVHSGYDNCLPPKGNSGTLIAQGAIGIPAPVAPYVTNLAQQVATSSAVVSAVAVLRPTAVVGLPNNALVRFYPLAGGLTRIVASFTGLTPSANYSMHVHQWGDVSSASGSAAGAHFNPAGAPHALYPTTPRHMGDIGNVIFADASGNAQVDIVRDLISFTADTQGNIIGRAVVVHKAPADDGTGATGNAGARSFVGVIGISAQAEPASSSSSSSTGAADSSTAADSSSSTGAALSSSSSTGGSASNNYTWSARADVFGDSTNATFAGVHGIFLFSQSGGANTTVDISVSITGLPVGTYAFHVHTYGDLSSLPIDANVVGGHFNPTGANHACYPTANRQVGDLGNLIITQVRCGAQRGQAQAAARAAAGAVQCRAVALAEAATPPLAHR